MPDQEPTHHILDPRTGEASAEGKLLIEDAGIQRLKMYPDITQIHPGDVLLFANLVPTTTCDIIASAHSKRGFQPRDAIWTHAGIYLRGGLFVEANLPRVRTTPIWPRVPTSLIRVRRATGRRDPATFGYRLALEMTTRIGEPYDRGVLWRIPFYSLLRRGRGSQATSQGRVFCSQVIADSFVALKEGDIYHDGSDLDLFRQVTPAHLSHSTILEDVRVRWLSLG